MIKENKYSVKWLKIFFCYKNIYNLNLVFQAIYVDAFVIDQAR